MPDSRKPKAFRVVIDHEDKVMENFFTPPYREQPFIAEAEVGRLLFAWSAAEDAIVRACTYWSEVHQLLDPQNYPLWKDPKKNHKRITDWSDRYVSFDDELGRKIVAVLNDALECRNNCAHNVRPVPDRIGWPPTVEGWYERRNFQHDQKVWIDRARRLGPEKAGKPPYEKEHFQYPVSIIADLAAQCTSATTLIMHIQGALSRHYFWRERGARRMRMCGADEAWAEMHRKVLHDEDLLRARAAKAKDPENWMASFSPSLDDFNWESV